MPQKPTIKQIVSTNIPTKFGTAHTIGYSDSELNTEHVALVFGEPDPNNALVRIHSECITGEAFHSLKCECGPQLTESMRACSIAGGIVIYMRGQEGRGIGLLNKLKAYALQEQGYDTVEANTALGLPDELREFNAAASILKDLAIYKVRLMSNNPIKIQALEKAGIEVIERVPLVVGVNPHNESYLQTKNDRMGHSIDLSKAGLS